MKNKFFIHRKFVFIVISSFAGFAAFLFIVLLGELLSGSIDFTTEFQLEPIHFQIAFLGGILQGSLKFFKYLNQSI